MRAFAGVKGSGQFLGWGMFAGSGSRLLAVSGERAPFAGFHVNGAVELDVTGTLFRSDP